MKKILISLTIFCCLSYFAIGQGLNNLYIYGYYGATDRGTMNLSSGVPVIALDTNIKIKMHYTHANISDHNGNLLFYTNGVVVIDGNHDTMPNGTGLNPCQYTTWAQYDGLSMQQADIIIPLPADTNKYYLFHQSLDYYSLYAASQIYYSIIDMTLNNGHGDIVQKNVSFIQDTLSGGMLTACKHANGRDWWLVIPKKFYPTYFIYLISPSGVQYISTQTIGNRYYQGQGAFSPDGNHWGYYDYSDQVEVFDFDRCSGLFSNYRYVTINDSNWGLGFCFSPNSKLAYSASAHHLYQYNLDSANLAASKQVVAEWDSTYSPYAPFETGFEFMQIGPDQKIYMSTVWATYRMHYINYPDSIGTACDVHQHGIILPCYNGNTIPNHPNYFLGPVLGSVCDSLGLGVSENIYSQNMNLRVNPNPAENMFYLNYQLPTGINADLHIYNTLGMEVMRKKLYWYFGYLQVDASGLGNGVYFLKVQTGKGSASGKVVIAR